MSIKIKSVLHSDERGYHFVNGSTENWGKRGNHDLWNGLTQFQTLGDGETQHSGDWVVQAAELTDACLSLATAIVTDPKHEAFAGSTLIDALNPVSERQIAFALSIKHKEDKLQYYSLGELKVSSGDKRNDRRFERVEPRHDGSINAAIGILNRSHWDVLQWLSLVHLVREHVSDKGGGYYAFDEISDFFADGKIKGDWFQAYRALRYAADAINGLYNCERFLSSAKFNSMPKGALAVA